MNTIVTLVVLVGVGFAVYKFVTRDKNNNTGTGGSSGGGGAKPKKK